MRLMTLLACGSATCSTWPGGFSSRHMCRHFCGLGLGLYIATEIAKAHGGSIEVDSSEKETRFTFRMPCHAR